MEKLLQKPMWSPDDLSRYTDISKARWATKRIDGSGPPFVKIGQGRTAKIRYRRDAVLDWLREREFSTTKERARKDSK